MPRAPLHRALYLWHVSSLMSHSPPAPSPLRDVLVGAAVLVGLLALYLVPAQTLGFWEPWETSLATFGWELAAQPETSLFAPVLDQAPLARPWLQTLLLTVGFGLGEGSELGFRLPFIALTVFAAVWAYAMLTPLFGRGRAALAAVLFGVMPGVLLGAVNLAGEAWFVGPATIAMTTTARICGRPDRARAPLLVVLGAALAFCFWGPGVAGLAAPLAVLAAFAVGARIDAHRADPVLPFAVAGGLVFVAFVVVPLLWTMKTGAALLPELAQAAIDAGAPAPTSAWAAGWGATKNLTGAAIALGIPLSVLLVATPGSRARYLFHPIGTPIAAAVAAALVVLPMREVIAVYGTLPDVTAHDIVGHVLYRAFFDERVLPDHVTFDVIIRLTGAAAYPTVALAPFGFGYLLRTADPSVQGTDDRSAGARSVKLLLLLWAGIFFAAFGISATLSRYTVFALGMPIAAAVALGMTDRTFVKQWRTNRLAAWGAGIASALLLAVLSKDIRGTFDEEMGRPGPHVIFEGLLTDGDVAFPDIYEFGAITVFVLLWLVAMSWFFFQPIDTLRRLGLELQRFAVRGRADAADGCRLARIGRRVAIFAIADFKGRILVRVADTIDGFAARIGAGPGRIGVTAGLFAALVVAWGGSLAMSDLPEVTNHFSQKGLHDTWSELREGDEPLYAAGIAAGENTYYLREGQVERLTRLQDLREVFCREGRSFAVIPTDRLGEAYYHVRRETDDEACPPQDLNVLDARSSRYVLISDELREDAGEVQQSFIAENVFSFETLPDDVRRYDPPIVVDGRFELVASQINPTVIDSGDVIVDTYWHVLEQPRSGWEAFIHVDFGGNRINGDHDPVEGRFAMNHWIPGEIVRDRYVIDVSSVDKAGTYTVFYGFFRGDDRLELEPSDPEDRMNLGTLVVE